jgi:HEPN domain-containing protein
VEPPRTHSLERLVEAIESAGIDAGALRSHHLKALSRMTTAPRYPDDKEAPNDLFDARESDSALATARAIMVFVRHQLTA